MPLPNDRLIILSSGSITLNFIRWNISEGMLCGLVAFFILNVLIMSISSILSVWLMKKLCAFLFSGYDKKSWP